MTGHVTDSELLREPDEPEGCSSEEVERAPAERCRFAEKLKKIDPAAFVGFIRPEPLDRRLQRWRSRSCAGGCCPVSPSGTAGRPGPAAAPGPDGRYAASRCPAMLCGESGTVISTQGSPSPSLLSCCRTAPAGGQGVCAPCRARRRRTAPPVPVRASFADPARPGRWAATRVPQPVETPDALPPLLLPPAGDVPPDESKTSPACPPMS